MRLSRVFHPDPHTPLTPGQRVELSTDAAGHLLRVLRLRNGDAVVLFNGDGNDYLGELVDCSKKSAFVQLKQKTQVVAESGLQIHLAQGVSRGEKMDFTLQKSVELGVSEITPIITERCGVKLNAERMHKKTQHWQKVVISACEQSGRAVVPKVNPTLSLDQWLALPSDALRINLHPRASHGLSKVSGVEKGIELLIGPEGGLSDQEIEKARLQGFKDVLIGPRVLRTETAALSAISILQSHFGDLG